MISPVVSSWEPSLTEPLLKKLDRSLFRDGETVIVAVSGGADSVALLDLLNRCRRPALSLVVAHLNHTLRGVASDGDESFVASLAESYGLPFVSRRSDVAAIAVENKFSVEEAGRCARYEFLAEVAAGRGATSIALAHHRDDQAETVLMRLLRGAGGAGLAAMRPMARGMLKRPLLGISRSELEEYLKSRGLTWRNDESNSDTSFLRNSIRHELIPMLRRYNPAVTARLCATAEILAADEELLQQVTAQAFARCCRECDEGVAVDCEALAQEPAGLRLRVFRRGIATVKGDLARIAMRHLEAVDALLAASSPSASIDLPDRITVFRRYGELYIGRIEDTASRHLPAERPGKAQACDRPDFNRGLGKGEVEDRDQRDHESVSAPEWQAHHRHHQLPLDWPVAIPCAGRYPLPGGRTLVLQRVPNPRHLIPPSSSVAFMSLEGVPFPMVVRGFLPGDRFRPLGMEGEQKVKDLLINRKIPRSQRSSVPLLFSCDNLVWVCGIRLSESARIADEATEVLRVELLPWNS